MPKLNTFAAAALAATTLIAPVNAGEPNSYYAPTGYPAPVYTGPASPHGHGPSYTHGQSGASAAALGYASSGSAYASSSAYASGGSAYASASGSAVSGHRGLTATGYSADGLNYAMNTSGPVNITADDIVCVLGTQEVPCDSVAGLSEALHSQGLHSIADALPPARPGANGYGVPTHVGGYAGNQYAGGQNIHGARYATATASASASSYASGGGYVYSGATASAGTSYGAATSTTLRTSSSADYGSTGRYITTGATGYGSGHYSQQAPGYASEVWVTPCGQVISKRISRPASPCAAPIHYAPAPVIYEPAPLSVRLSDGTMYALNGGVGAGIYGEFYGGGGSVIQSGSSYSGVLNASASQFTFNKKRTPRPTTRYPKPNTRYPKPNTRYPKGGGCNGGC